MINDFWINRYLVYIQVAGCPSSLDNRRKPDNGSSLCTRRSVRSYTDLRNVHSSRPLIRRSFCWTRILPRLQLKFQDNFSVEAVTNILVEERSEFKKQLTWYTFDFGISHVIVGTSADRDVFVHVTKRILSAYTAENARIHASGV